MNISEKNIDHICHISPMAKVDGILYEIRLPTGDLRSADFYTSLQVMDDPVKQRFDVVKKIHTRHEVIGDAVFEPTIAEVISQIPNDLIDRVCGFSIDDKIPSGEYWVGEVTLYGHSRIPYITDEELMRRAKTIVPLVRNDGILHHIELGDLRRKNFLQDPDIRFPAGYCYKFMKIVTYHPRDFTDIFKPTVAQVLAQIPGVLLDNVRLHGFEVNGPKDMNDVNRYPQERDEGYHVAITTLYH